MAENNSESIDPNKVEAVSLDDWVVEAVSIDEWVVEEEAEVKESPKKEEVVYADATAETIVMPPEPVKVEEKIESVSLDDWVLDEEDESESNEIEIQEDELEGPIEVDDNTFAESGSIDRELLESENQTQSMDVNLQGDLAELEETNLEEISIEAKSEIEEISETSEEEDDEDLLSDFDEEPGMLVNDDPFEPDEPVPSVGDIEFPPTTMQNVELDFSDAETVVEETEVSKEEVLEASLDAAEPIPSVEDGNTLEFPPTEMEKVELDFNSETAIQEMAEAKELESEDSDQEATIELNVESSENDDLELVESSVDLDLEEDKLDEPLNLDEDIESDEIETVESKIDLDLDEDEGSETIEESAREEQIDLSSETPEDSTFDLETEPEGDLPSFDKVEVDAAEPFSPLAEVTDPDEVVAEIPAADLDENTLQLKDQDLAEQHWVRLTELDLAENHQLGVLRLTETDLRENSVLPVIRLHEIDFAERHRKVIELDPNFFVEHDIERDVKGVILLKAEDLVDPSCLEEKEKAPREKIRKKRETKESFLTDAMIVKISAIVIVFCLVAIPIAFHFKYAWVTVSQKRYEEIKANTGAIDWVYKTMFEYRTSDSSFRWYGKRKLNSRAYKKAEDAGEMMWLRYTESSQGDNYP